MTRILLAGFLWFWKVVLVTGSYCSGDLDCCSSCCVLASNRYSGEFDGSACTFGCTAGFACSNLSGNGQLETACVFGTVFAGLNVQSNLARFSGENLCCSAAGVLVVNPSDVENCSVQSTSNKLAASLGFTFFGIVVVSSLAGLICIWSSRGRGLSFPSYDSKLSKRAAYRKKSVNNNNNIGLNTSRGPVIRFGSEASANLQPAERTIRYHGFEQPMTVVIRNHKDQNGVEVFHDGPGLDAAVTKDMTAVSRGIHLPDETSEQAIAKHKSRQSPRYITAQEEEDEELSRNEDSQNEFDVLRPSKHYGFDIEAALKPSAARQASVQIGQGPEADLELLRPSITFEMRQNHRKKLDTNQQLDEFLKPSKKAFVGSQLDDHDDEDSEM